MSGVGFDGKPFLLCYPWVSTDAGRSQSKRPRQRNDCTVRALALALDCPYDQAYDTLKTAGRIASKGFHFSEWINAQPWATKISFPAVKGERRMNPASFTKQYPIGRFVCKTSKHVFCVDEGVVYDELDNRPDRCIYTAWRIDVAVAARV